MVSDALTSALQLFLVRRKDFLLSHSLDAEHVLYHPEREAICKQWKEELHDLPGQVEQQHRDSWKSSQEGSASQPVKGGKRCKPGIGDNNEAVLSGKHFRFLLHFATC